MSPGFKVALYVVGAMLLTLMWATLSGCSVAAAEETEAEKVEYAKFVEALPSEEMRKYCREHGDCIVVSYQEINDFINDRMEEAFQAGGEAGVQYCLNKMILTEKKP